MSLERSKLTRLVDTRDIDGISAWVDEVVSAVVAEYHAAIERQRAEVERVCGPPPTTLRERISRAINATSAENGSNTPDFLLADYLVDCLDAYNRTVSRRSSWYGRMDHPAGGGK